MSTWHYALDDHKHGPISLEDLQALAADGTVTPDTLVWTDGMPDWKPVRDVPELGLAVQSPPPIPVGPPVSAPRSAAPRTTPGPIPVVTGDATGGVIPYKNPCALIGYYLAIISLFPMVGILTGAIAVGLGVAGLKARKRNPAVKGSAHAWIAILLGGFCALAYTGVIVAIVVLA